MTKHIQISPAPRSLARMAACCLAISCFLLAGCGSSAQRPRFVIVTPPQVVQLPLAPPLGRITLSLAPQVAAQAALVYDPQTGATLYSLHGDQERAMASTTKIMTAVVAILSGKIDQPVTVTAAAENFAPDVSVVCCPQMQIGQVYTLHQLLYGLLLPSGADAASLIAVTVAGSEAAFVSQMNAMAAWLGLTHTHYENVHGLDQSGHYTTAEDLAHLTTFALSLPIFRQIVAIPRYTIPASTTHPAITLENTNELLSTGKALGVDGVKTGTTGAAGYCVVIDASHAGRELIVVILADASDQGRFDDAARLLRWAFALPSG